MIHPGINKAEAYRLMNEIGKADVWFALCGNIEAKEITTHSDDLQKGLALLTAYILHNDDYRAELLDIIKQLK